MFFLLFGADTFRSRKRLSSMRERFSVTRDSSGMNSVLFRAKDTDADEVLASLFASPFLADKKMLILDGFLRAPAAVQERIKEALAKKPESTNVIFYEDVAADDLAKSPLLPLLKAQKFTEECAAMSGMQLEAFAVQECAAQGITLGSREARQLVTAVGTDTWQLHAEIEKLCAYAAAQGAKAVTQEMLGTLVPGEREESLFELIDACVDGRCGQAAVMLERMLASGTSPIQVITMLQKQYRTMIGVADLVMRGERDKNAVARRLGIHPFPAGKAMAAVRRHSPADLARHQSELLEMERQAKTSAGDPAVLLGVWIAKMQQPAH